MREGGREADICRVTVAQKGPSSFLFPFSGVIGLSPTVFYSHSSWKCPFLPPYGWPPVSSRPPKSISSSSCSDLGVFSPYLHLLRTTMEKKSEAAAAGVLYNEAGSGGPHFFMFSSPLSLLSLLSALMGKVLTHRGALASEKTILGPSLLEEGKGERKLEICRPLLNSVNNKEREAFANDLFCDLVHCRPLHLRLSPITLLQNLH